MKNDIPIRKQSLHNANKPVKVCYTETERMQIRKCCKLARGITAKKHTTNRHKPRPWWIISMFMSIFHSKVQFFFSARVIKFYTRVLYRYIYIVRFIYCFFALPKIRLLSSVVLFNECWEINMAFRAIFNFWRAKKGQKTEPCIYWHFWRRLGFCLPMR